ncbi:hypothetical protein GOP47_0007003 [Adiantum capillus-veneris]|uniref:ubiquitinyl hydrolase 1 n=1 Tax=Adiantum capillus-veneris TaxID=13818 RepID=A0A9D4V050_ADICA|nr:hypothetical protein GOP47_0007003 [Adiantum capillus-veneris]
MCISSCCSLPWRRTASPPAMPDQPVQPPPIYHERQRRELCLLHALNGLYQSKAFTRCQLNTIACVLPSEVYDGGPCSRLRSLRYNIFYGDYDANVLARALQSRGAEMTYHLDADAINLDDPSIIGFIFNHDNCHWAALKKINGAWVDLDSYRRVPTIVGNDDEVRQLMQQNLANGSVLIRVISSEGRNQQSQPA